MPMSQEHKDALAQGRKESRAIKAYLKALTSRKPGRPVTKESLSNRLNGINEKIEAEDDPLKSVELIQKRLDIEEELARFEESENLEELEKDFIEHAHSYSERKGITYSAWREAGVAAATLREAGIKETRRRV